MRVVAFVGSPIVEDEKEVSMCSFIHSFMPFL